jgi:hypothetical protein
MWQESDAAVREMLNAESLRRSGAKDDGQTVSNWWSEHGIDLKLDRLDRNALFSLASEHRRHADPDWVSLLWHVLAWGVMGDFRNAPTIINSVADQGARSRLNQQLKDAASSSYQGLVEESYKMLHRKVPRLGPAFFTKFLYFTSDRSSPRPRCLILDSRVESAIFALTGLDFSKQDSATYERFCKKVAQWSDDFQVEPEEIEFRLYRFGQRIDSRRWRWLDAEVSLYREGRRDVDFDLILERVSSRGRNATKPSF